MGAMGAATPDDPLVRGREALAAGDWGSARSCFERGRERGAKAGVLHGPRRAAHFQGEQVAAIELKERAFAAFLQEDKVPEAAEAARWLAFLHGAVHGNLAAANGWMTRA